MQRILHYNVFCHNRAFLDPCERFADDPCWYVHLVVYYVLILVEKLCSLLLYIYYALTSHSDCSDGLTVCASCGTGYIDGVW